MLLAVADKQSASVARSTTVASANSRSINGGAHHDAHRAHVPILFNSTIRSCYYRPR